MEKKQFELCLNVLRRFHEAGILQNLILIGSWCIIFYKDYFNSAEIDRIGFKTRDMDFLVDNPSKIKNEVDVPLLLEDLGFVTHFRGEKGYIRLDHPDLILEFLVAEKGKGSNRPFLLPKLKVNAIPLRFLNFLSSNTMKVKVEDFFITLPHPANFALHKLIIFQRRQKEDKAVKDRRMAISILDMLIEKGEAAYIKKIFLASPSKWQSKIITGLKTGDEKHILEILEAK